MPTVRAQVDVTGPLAAAEALWYDTARWPAFIDGFGHLAKLEGAWPEAESKVVWDSTPNGRGRVVERVVAHAPGERQTLEVEDPRLHGTQRIAFEPLDGGTGLALELEYALKPGSVFQPVVDVFFIRRALRESLRRTLLRFARELASDLELRK